MNDPVIIVGGGLSGLYAARLLAQAGADFCLLEARERLGGRILSPDGHDLGPTWFWPGMQPMMVELVHTLGLDAFAQHDAGDVLFERAPDVRAERYAGFGQMASSFRLRGGMGTLVAALEAALPPERIRLGTRVRAARLADGGVALEVEKNGVADIIAARHVLFAAPPRLLESHVDFSPLLSAELRMRWRGTPTWMAPHAKFLASYARPFWRDAGLSGTAQSMAGPMSEIHDASVTADGEGAALFGFLGVPAALRMKAGEEAIRHHCLAQLTRLFGQEAGAPLASAFQDWAADPFTATALDAEAAGHPEPQSLPWFGGTWTAHATMAGSESAREHPGYLEGALAAARDAVAAGAWARGL